MLDPPDFALETSSQRLFLSAVRDRSAPSETSGASEPPAGTAGVSGRPGPTLARPPRRTRRDLVQPGRPRLKLSGLMTEPVEVDAHARASAVRNERATLQRLGTPLRGATDPRWVLAVRCAEQLQGAILSPERRERLIELGRVLGLSPFDANLVIAIVQDQARRGYPPAQSLEMCEPHLAMVNLGAGHGRGRKGRARLRRGSAEQATRSRWFAPFAVALVLAIELALLWLWMR